jgi:hypothetical protein
LMTPDSISSTKLASGTPTVRRSPIRRSKPVGMPTALTSAASESLGAKNSSGQKPPEASFTGPQPRRYSSHSRGDPCFVGLARCQRRTYRLTPLKV